VDTLTFEEAYRRLEETVEKLSAGGLPLEESLRLFEQGMALANYCSTLLDRAELRVQQVGQLPPDELDALLDAPPAEGPRLVAGPADPSGGRPAAEAPRRGADPAPARNTPLGGPYRRAPGAERPPPGAGPRDRRSADYDPLFDEDL
jgi:exodeoxyribonuclease VII small subunit